jgi:hypothetical protein
MLPTPRLSRSSIRIHEVVAVAAALKKKTCARIADLDGDSAASILLDDTAAEDDALVVRPDVCRRRPTRLNVLSVAKLYYVSEAPLLVHNYAVHLDRTRHFYVSLPDNCAASPRCLLLCCALNCVWLFEFVRSVNRHL